MRIPQWRNDLGAVTLLLVIATGIAWHLHLTNPPHWGDPDSLYYRAWVLRLEGSSKAHALAHVFNGPLSRKQRAGERAHPTSRPRVSDPAWVSYSSRFYERRWVTPALGAALDPVFGASGLIIVSLLGYVLVGPFLFLFLRQRFPIGIAGMATLIILLLGRMRYFAPWPMTDMLGLVLECLALALGLIALRSGGRWIAAWAIAVLVLSFTRDAEIVVLAGALMTLLVRRDIRSTAVFATGFAATLPGPLIFGAPLRETMGYTLNGFFPAPDGWSFVVRHYPHGVHQLLRDDWRFVLRHEVDGLILCGGFIALLVCRRAFHDSSPFVLGAALGSIAGLLLLPNYSEFRLELSVAPLSAAGLAALGMSIRRPRRTFRLNSGPVLTQAQRGPPKGSPTLSRTADLQGVRSSG